MLLDAGLLLTGALLCSTALPAEPEAESARSSGQEAPDRPALPEASSGGSAPPPAPAVRYHYYGVAGEGRYDLAEVVRLIRSDPEGEHYLWVKGWDDWRAWRTVTPVARAVQRQVSPPPVPGSGRESTYQYYDGAGERQELSIDRIVERVREDPTGTHWVWRPGYEDWVAARDVPRIQTALKTATGSAPPRLPVETDPDHVSPPAPQTADERTARSGLRARLGGEVWTLGTLEEIQRLTNPDDPPIEGGFLVRRARLRADVGIGERVDARVNLHLGQSSSTTDYAIDLGSFSTTVDGEEYEVETDEDASVTVDDHPEGWGVAMRDAWVQYRIAAMEQRVRVGLQKPVFGTRDYFDSHEHYFLGGREAYKSLSWRAGISPTRDVGVAWQGRPVGALVVDAQALNGTDGEDGDDALGKDLIGRLRLAPFDWIELQASGQYGRADEYNSTHQARFSGSVEVRPGHARGIVEGILGWESEIEGATEPPFLGFMLAGAYDVPLQAPALDRFTFLGRYMVFDPDTQAVDDEGYVVPDAWAIVNGAAQLYWTTPAEATLLTGLVYEAEIPQDALETVRHAVAIQLISAF